MSVSTALQCGDFVTRGGKYVFATYMCILISCSSVLCVLMELGICIFVKVMSSWTK